MKRYSLWFIVIFLSLTIGYHIVTVWRGMVFSQEGTSRETLLKAIDVDSNNPAPFNKLGLLHQWSLRQLDLKESDHLFEEAIGRNPLEQEYWLNLAKVFKATGRGQDYERALDNAILVFPTGYRGRWIAGNLLLQQGVLEKALPHFSYILTHYPNQSSLVYDVWEKAVDDPDFILENLVPKDPFSLKQYLVYLYDAGDKESAGKAWGKRATLGSKPDREETLRHIDFLISKGEFNEAFRLWKMRLEEEGFTLSLDGNLITNGGFERDKDLGTGFDWKIGKVSGAEISFDDSVFFEEKRSLKITFSGKENVDFQQIGQLVALKPDTDYWLKAHMRTRGITTKSGLKIEVSGVGPAFYGASEGLTGDNEWKELTVTFRTPSVSQGCLVRVRREKIDKFDRLISGEVWIDNVQLRETRSDR